MPGVLWTPTLGTNFLLFFFTLFFTLRDHEVPVLRPREGCSRALSGERSPPVTAVEAASLGGGRVLGVEAVSIGGGSRVPDVET